MRSSCPPGGPSGRPRASLRAPRIRRASSRVLGPNGSAPSRHSTESSSVWWGIRGVSVLRQESCCSDRWLSEVERTGRVPRAHALTLGGRSILVPRSLLGRCPSPPDDPPPGLPRGYGGHVEEVKPERTRHVNVTFRFFGVRRELGPPNGSADPGRFFPSGGAASPFTAVLQSWKVCTPSRAVSASAGQCPRPSPSAVAFPIPESRRTRAVSSGRQQIPLAAAGAERRAQPSTSHEPSPYWCVLGAPCRKLLTHPSRA